MKQNMSDCKHEFAPYPERGEPHSVRCPKCGESHAITPMGLDTVLQQRDALIERVRYLEANDD
jgi:hypothetical protein